MALPQDIPMVMLTAISTQDRLLGLPVFQMAPTIEELVDAVLTIPLASSWRRIGLIAPYCRRGNLIRRSFFQHSDDLMKLDLGIGHDYSAENMHRVLELARASNFRIFFLGITTPEQFIQFSLAASALDWVANNEYVVLPVLRCVGLADALPGIRRPDLAFLPLFCIQTGCGFLTCPVDFLMNSFVFILSPDLMKGMSGMAEWEAVDNALFHEAADTNILGSLLVVRHHYQCHGSLDCRKPSPPCANWVRRKERQGKEGWKDKTRQMEIWDEAKRFGTRREAERNKRASYFFLIHIFIYLYI